jgi:hypothetical protein
MKRFVLSDAGSAWTLGAIGGVIVAVTDASAGVTYLLAVCLGAIGMAIMFGPDRARRSREKRNASPKL